MTSSLDNTTSNTNGFFNLHLFEKTVKAVIKEGIRDNYHPKIITYNVLEALSAQQSQLTSLRERKVKSEVKRQDSPILLGNGAFTKFLNDYQSHVNFALNVLKAKMTGPNNILKHGPEKIAELLEKFSTAKIFIKSQTFQSSNAEITSPSIPYLDEMTYYEKTLEKLKPQVRSQDQITDICLTMKDPDVIQKILQRCKEVKEDFNVIDCEYLRFINNWNLFQQQFVQLDFFHHTFETITSFAIPFYESFHKRRDVNLEEYANFEKKLSDHLNNQKEWCSLENFPNYVYSNQTKAQFKEWFTLVINTPSDISYAVKEALATIIENPDLTQALFENQSVLETLLDWDVSSKDPELLRLKKFVKQIHETCEFVKAKKIELEDILSKLETDFHKMADYTRRKEAVDLIEDLEKFNTTLRKHRLNDSLKTVHENIVEWREVFTDLNKRVPSLSLSTLLQDQNEITTLYETAKQEMDRANRCVNSTLHLKTSNEQAKRHYIWETQYHVEIAGGATLKSAYNLVNGAAQMVGL